jgi:archaellum component FlaG (FlaF/FlaG flagellin family)
MRKQLTAEEQAQIVSDVIVDESQKYSDVLKKQYDIIMLPNKLSNKVKAKAQELTRGRYEINLNKVKEPVTI